MLRFHASAFVFGLLAVSGRTAGASEELDFIDRPLVAPEQPPGIALAAAGAAAAPTWTVLVGASALPDAGTVNLLTVVSLAKEWSTIAIEPAVSIAGSSINEDARAGELGISVDTQPKAFAGRNGGGVSFEPGVTISDGGDVSGELSINGKLIPSAAPGSPMIYSVGAVATVSYAEDVAYKGTGILSVGRRLGTSSRIALAAKPTIAAAPADADPSFGAGVELTYARKAAARQTVVTLGARAANVEALAPSASVTLKAAFVF